MGEQTTTETKTEEPETPPNLSETSKKTQKKKIKTKISSHSDLEGILLRPNPDLNELAVLNPSLYQGTELNNGPWPFIYRTEIPDNSLFQRHSIIDFRWLNTPKKLSKTKRTIIKPEFDYEIIGCEDPKLTKVKDTYYITYIAFDGINARIALATTKDFKHIIKRGIIGPQIPLEKAIGLVKDETYKKTWKRDYQCSLKRLKELKSNQEIYLWDKDAILDYNKETNFWELSHRLDPNSHIARAKHWKNFQKPGFWGNQIKNIHKHTSIKKDDFPWACFKVGWGSPTFKVGDKTIALWHGVDEELNYRTSFCEIKNGKIVSIISNPWLEPKKEDRAEYLDKKGNSHSKNVIFSTASLEQKDRVWIYSGSADLQIKYRTTDPNWMYKELNAPNNRRE